MVGDAPETGENMKLLWSTQIEEPGLWEPHCRGRLVRSGGKSWFLYMRSRQVVGAAVGPEGLTEPEVLISDLQIDLPGRWFASAQIPDGLICGEDCCLDLRTLQRVDADVRQEYRDKGEFGGYLIPQLSYRFGEYTVSQNQRSGFRCRRGDAPVWRFSAQGYLYTDIVRSPEREDAIVFGTDGHGGHFYMLDLATGKPICDLNTRGTNHYVCTEGSFYLLSREQRSKLLRVSAYDGSVTEELLLEGKINTSSRILRDGDDLLATTFRYKAGAPVAMLVHYAQL